MQKHISIKGALRRLHYGPGPHPGTGSPQSVHGNGGTGVKISGRPKMLRMSSVEAQERAAELTAKYKKEGEFFDVTTTDDGFIIFLDRDTAIEWWIKHDRELDYEVGRIFNDEKQIFTQKGERDHIAYTPQDQWAITELRKQAEEKGQAFIKTHNHPGDIWTDEKYDYPPSFSDFQSAFVMGVGEWQVITPSGKYIVTDGPKMPLSPSHEDATAFHHEWIDWTDAAADFYVPGVNLMNTEEITARLEDDDFRVKYLELLNDRILDVTRDSGYFKVEWIEK